MNHRRILVVAGGLLALFATNAAAQVQVKVTSPKVGSTAVTWDPAGPEFGAFYVSPYTGVLVATNQSVVLNCVDFFHEVTLNNTYWANKTFLSDASLSNTRFNNLEWYLQAAWLTQQYSSPNPGSTPDQTIAIQAAIWNIFTAAAPDKADGSGLTSQTYWMEQAALKWNTVDAGKFYVLTATNKDDASSAQEFLVYDANAPSAVPEPATLTLLATGVAGLAAYKRRRQKAAGAAKAALS